jgi:hypothetical protein
MEHFAPKADEGVNSSVVEATKEFTKAFLIAPFVILYRELSNILTAKYTHLRNTQAYTGG